MGWVRSHASRLVIMAARKKPNRKRCLRILARAGAGAAFRLETERR